jgi:hypothetical protein
MEFLLLFLALLALFYVLGPLAVMAQQRQPVPRMRRIAVEEAPAAVAKALAGWTAAFGQAMPLVAIQELTIPETPVYTLPFSEEDRNPPPDHPPPAAGHVLHFVDREAGVHGLDYVTPRLRWQVLLTRYDEDEEVVTHNSPVASSFARHPRVHALRMATVRNLASLRGMHDAHVRHVMGTRVPLPIPPDAALAEFVMEHEVRAVERQRELGMMQRRRGVYRPTLKGAFRSAWSLLPPLVFVRMWRDGRQAAAVRRVARAAR